MNATVTKKTLSILGALGALCLGLWWGGHPGDLPSFLRSAFVANPHDVVINDALSDIQRDYFHPVARGGLIDGALAGAVSSLNDPYAAYFTPKQYSAFNHPQPQHFSGVGIIVLPAHAGLLVQDVVPGSPAARAGVRPGDVLTTVGGRALAGLGIQQSTNLIRGRIGTAVKLGVQRGAHRLTFTVERRLVPQPVVTDAVTSAHGVRAGIISLPTFDISGIHAQVATVVEALLRRHVKAIVLDLRDNGGGLVTEAQLVTSMFLRHGVIVTTRGRTQASETISATGHPIAPAIPLAVLVNASTASAAEIVTGALQDHHRAVIVGTRTYGKGVFQEIRPLPNGGALDITVGQYFLPNGSNLGAGGLRRGAGITPDVTVKTPPSATSDPQLDAALKALAARAH